ncbi:MAG: asparaginase [Candidatus Omnitrophica bacterium]|nr:asparaginase [Candidatus Omnitrophota bacterium]
MQIVLQGTSEHNTITEEFGMHRNQDFIRALRERAGFNALFAYQALSELLKAGIIEEIGIGRTIEHLCAIAEATRNNAQAAYSALPLLVQAGMRDLGKITELFRSIRESRGYKAKRVYEGIATFAVETGINDIETLERIETMLPPLAAKIGIEEKQAYIDFSKLIKAGISVESGLQILQSIGEKDKVDLIVAYKGLIALSETDNIKALIQAGFSNREVLDLLQRMVEKNILQAAHNSFISRKTMDLKPEEFKDVTDLLVMFSSSFVKNNKALAPGRRFSEGVFRDEYLPLAYSLEIILPGSIRQMMTLLEKGIKPQAIIRFLEQKQTGLLSEEASKAIVDFIVRKRETHAELSRKKFKVDISTMHAVLNIASSFVEINNINALVHELESFDSTQNFVNLRRYLQEKFLAYFAESFGIEEANVKPEAYEKIYTPYLTRLTQAKKHIAALENKEKLPRFIGLVMAVFEDRFWNFIEHKNQKNSLGRSIALHNENVRKALNKVGINVKRWLGKERIDRMSNGEFMYYEKSVYKYDPVSDINVVIDYIIRVMNIESVGDIEKERIAKYLESNGINTVYEGGKVVNLKVLTKAKKEDIVTILSDKSVLSGLLDLIDGEGGLISLGEIRNFPNALETITHFKERIETLVACLDFPEYQKELGRLRKYFTVRPILRQPGRDIFLGDFSSCCLAMNSDIYPEAMVDRLIDEGMNVIEAIDDATGETMACLWLYISEDGSLVIQNIEINAAYEKIKPLMYRVGEGMIEYAYEFAQYIGAKQLLIGMPGHGKYFGGGGFVEERYKDKVVDFRQQKIGGYLGREYYLDSAGKPEAYLIEPEDATLVIQQTVGQVDRIAETTVDLAQPEEPSVAHFSVASRYNRLTDDDQTDRFGVLGNSYIIKDDEEFDVGAIKGAKRLGDPITVRLQNGQNVNFTIHGPPEKERLADYLHDHTHLLEEAVLERSVTLHPGELSQNITIVLADQYDFLAGDHRDNNIIILNASDLEEMLEQGEDERFVSELITSLLSEELAHERGAGKDEEPRLAQACAANTVDALTAQQKDLSEYIAFIEEHGDDLEGEKGYLGYLKDKAASLRLTDEEVRRSPVVVATGGTIDMSGAESRRGSAGVLRILKEMGTQVIYRSVFEHPPDSSNIGPDAPYSWKDIFEVIKKTLEDKGQPFTGRLTIPVVFTGAHSPATEEGSDAIPNLARSLLVVSDSGTPPLAYTVIGNDIFLATNIIKLFVSPKAKLGDAQLRRYFDTFGEPVGTIIEDGTVPTIKWNEEFLKWADVYTKGAERPKGVSGIVVSHGTDTLSESALAVSLEFANQDPGEFEQFFDHTFGFVEHIPVGYCTSLEVFRDYKDYLIELQETEPGARHGLIIQGDFSSNKDFMKIKEEIAELTRREIPIPVFSGSRAVLSLTRDIGVKAIPEGFSYRKARTKLSWLLRRGVLYEDLERELATDYMGEITLSGQERTKERWEFLHWLKRKGSNPQPGREIIIAFPGMRVKPIQAAIKRLLKQRATNPQELSELVIMAFGDGNLPTGEQTIVNVFDQYLRDRHPELYDRFRQSMDAIIDQRRLEEPGFEPNFETAEQAFSDVLVKGLSNRELRKLLEAYKGHHIHNPKAAIFDAVKQKVLADAAKEGIRDIPTQIKLFQEEMAKRYPFLDVGDKLYVPGKTYKSISDLCLDMSQAFMDLSIDDFMEVIIIQPSFLSQRIIKDAMMDYHELIRALGQAVDKGIKVKIKTKAYQSKSNTRMYELGNHLLVIGADSDEAPGWDILRPEDIGMNEEDSHTWPLVKGAEVTQARVDGDEIETVSAGKIDLGQYLTDEEKMKHVFVFLARNVLLEPGKYEEEINGLRGHNRIVIIAQDRGEADRLRDVDFSFTDDIDDVVEIFVVGEDGCLKRFDKIERINAKVNLAIKLNKINVFGARLDTISNLDPKLAEAILSGV